MFCRVGCALLLSVLFLQLFLLREDHITPTANNSAGDRSNIDIDSSDEHGASFLISASLRQRSKHQAPTGYPSASERAIPVCPWTSSSSSSSSPERASPHRQNHCHSQPSQQPPASQQTHTSPTYEQRQATPPPRCQLRHLHARAHTRRTKQSHTPRRCNGRRRARYAVLSTTYRCPPAPAHSLSQCVKKPNASAAPVSHLPLPLTPNHQALHTSLYLNLPKPPPHCPPRVSPPPTASTNTDILDPCRGPAPFAQHCCPRDCLSIRQPVLQ